MATEQDFPRGQKPFRALLQAYKASGCSILVAGDVPDDVLEAASAHLLGDPAADKRTRVFGLFDRNSSMVHDRLDRAGYGRTPARVVTTDEQARTATTARPASDGGTNTTDTAERPFQPEYALDVSHVDATPLSGVADALADAMTPGDDRDGYTPAELRVCLDSLRPVLDGHSASEVDAFLESVTAAIDAHAGMGHAVLPAAPDSRVVEQVRDHFDILLPLRCRDGTPEQRWEFIAEDRTLDWHPL